MADTIIPDTEARETAQEIEVRKESEIKTGWGKSRQNIIIKRLAAGEDSQKIMDSFPGFGGSFRDLDTIDCSDGRVLKGRKIGIAGSGILLPWDEKKKFVERFRGRIAELTAHRDCGAADKKFAELQAQAPAEIPAGITNADDYGVFCGRQLADALGAKYSFLEELANPNHNEVALTLDATGRFDSTNLDSFPPHFVCTGAGLGFSREYMAEEMETLIGIALSHHGYGERFTIDSPFYILVIAKDSTELSVWETVAREVAEKFFGRVAVKGIVSPEWKK